MGKRCSQSEICEIFSVSPVAVRQWAERGMPYLERGSKGRVWAYDSRAVHDWLMDEELRRKGIGGPVGNDRSSLTHRKAAAETELREGELARKQGQLLPIGWFLEVVGRAFDNVNSKLSAIANRSAPLVAVETDVAKCHRIIERAVNEARRQLVAPEEQDLISAAVGELGIQGAIGKVQADTRTDS